jgi:hypothetical protein
MGITDLEIEKESIVSWVEIFLKKILINFD